jgi:uncharacterized protein (UPF0333 family)
MKYQLLSIILICLIVLIIASFYKMDSENKATLDVACSNEMICKVISNASNNSNCVKLETANNAIFYPVLTSENLVLVENSKVRICYTEIDSTNVNHKTISINKVVFLP